MGSTGNPNNPWGQYDSYKDCSQGVCSVYCPQWCYVIFPPPPSFFFDDEDDSSSSSDFSPLLIALIGILASAFILVSYYTLISKYCHRRRQISSSSSSTNREISVIDSWQQSNGAAPAPTPNANGLDESLIKSIKVYKFKKGDGFVESSDCSVCLSEFEEDENLRLLPKCNHAFHLPCIDTWFKSHSNCPLCRSFIDSVNQPIATESDSVSSDLSEDSDSVVVNVDLETRSEIGSTEKPEEEEVENRRSSSVVLISDILREIDDDDDNEEVGSSSRRFEEGDGEKTPPPSSDGKSSFLGRSKRSVSNGKFVISSYDRSRNYRLPN